MTPEERREAHLDAIMQDFTVYEDLLAYFDEHEPAVADAIRFGVTEVFAEGDYGCSASLTPLSRCHPKDQQEYRAEGNVALRVNYPQDEDSK